MFHLITVKLLLLRKEGKNAGLLRSSVRKVTTLRRIVDSDHSQTRQALMAVFKVHASADGSMTKDAFTRACEGDLKLNMTTAELSRVFDWATSKSIGSSQMNGDTFVQCVRQRFFSSSVSTLSTILSNFNIPNNFDYERDTASNCDGPGTPFLGAYKDIRATRDHSYGRYAEARRRCG